MPDNERIWVQQPDDAAPGGGEPVEYVRADVHAAEVERLLGCLRARPGTLLIAHEDGDHQRLSRALSKAAARAGDGEVRIAELAEALKSAKGFIDRTCGTALGLAMSGSEHPDPDGALMGLSMDGMALSAAIAAALAAEPGTEPDVAA